VELKNRVIMVAIERRVGVCQCVAMAPKDEPDGEESFIQDMRRK